MTEADWQAAAIDVLESVQPDSARKGAMVEYIDAAPPNALLQASGDKRKLQRLGDICLILETVMSVFVEDWPGTQAAPQTSWTSRRKVGRLSCQQTWHRYSRNMPKESWLVAASMAHAGGVREI